MGASDDSVAVGIAETYLAQGKDLLAERTLMALGDPGDYQQNFDYQLAWGNIYHQRHDTLRALTSYAHANQLAEHDPIVQLAQLEPPAQTTTPLNPTFS